MSKKLPAHERFLAGIRLTPIIFIVYLPFGLIINSLYPKVVEFALEKGYIVSPPAGREYHLWLLVMHVVFSLLAILVAVTGFKLLKRKVEKNSKAH